MKELLNNDSLLAITERLLGKKIGKDNVYKIQQTGTKYVGHAYFDVADNFLYECIVQTTGTVNTTANFKKCGVTENESKLQNLSKNPTIFMVREYIKDANLIQGLGSYRTDPLTKNIPINTHGILNITGWVSSEGNPTNYTVAQWIEYDTGRTFVRHFDVLPNIQWYSWREIPLN